MIPPPPQPSLPDVVVRARRTLPIVWIIPLVALLVAGSLWYEVVRERGPEITIRFATAQGLQAGKTQLRVKDVSVGVVASIALNDDLSGVTVTARMDRGSERFLLDGTRFWVVRPRFGLGGISGLETVVSGAFIAIDPGGSGEPILDFTGLESPPLSPVDSPGLRLTLLADGKGSLDVGSAVSHRQIEVGRIEGVRWLESLDGVAFDVYVEAPFTGLVHANTRFWNTSGVHVSLSAEGLSVQTESLDALFGGGLAFGLPEGEAPGAPARSGDVFPLHADAAGAQDVRGERYEYLLSFRESVRGLSPGAPVEFLGIKIGRVRRVELEFDPATMEARLPVLIEIEPVRIGVLGARERDPDERRELLTELVAQGLRARLQTGNLLTGGLFVEMVMRPETPVVLTGGGGEDGLLEIPTIPSPRATLGDTLGKLPELVADLARSSEALARMLDAIQASGTLAALASSARDLAGLVARLHDDLPETLADARGVLAEVRGALSELRGTLDGAQQALSVVSRQGDDAGRQLQRTLAEVAEAAASLGRLADYLQRHPEALLSGKGDTR